MKGEYPEVGARLQADLGAMLSGPTAVILDIPGSPLAGE